MPSHNKKKSSFFNYGKSSTKLLGDLTINHFANSPVPAGVGRLSKSISNGLVTAQKTYANQTPSDKEIDLLVKDSEALYIGDVDEDGEVIVKCRRRNKSSTSSTNSDIINNNSESHGKHYPIDLWYILSRYIRPEDVVQFSLLCKSSYHVVNSPNFWISLYKRYVMGNPNIGKSLTSKCTEKHEGLKANVVRCLFSVYPPLSKRETPQALASLTNMYCRVMWIEKKELFNGDSSSVQQQSVMWYYKFKFSRSRYRPDPEERKKNVIDNLNCDIKSNPEEGCKILTVVSKEYQWLPCVAGMRLMVAANVTPRQVKLLFTASPLNTSQSQLGNFNFLLSSLQAPTISDWWQPSYFSKY